MKELLENLKKHLLQNKDNFVSVNDWCGDTESGFYTEETLDIVNLLFEIDNFAATFEKKAKE